MIRPHRACMSDNSVANTSVLEVQYECCLSTVALESPSETTYYVWRNIINTLMMIKG